MTVPVFAATAPALIAIAFIVGAIIAWPKRKAQPAAVSPTPVSTADELERISALHAAGSLTSDEFQAAKTKLLGRRDAT